MPTNHTLPRLPEVYRMPVTDIRTSIFRNCSDGPSTVVEKISKQMFI